jgi:aryl-alcohol dehydrogenase-like predicted oxidoreductase
MEFRRLGRTNLKVSLISLGGAQLEAVDELQAKRVIDKAVSYKINFIDTATKYKEEKLNLALRDKQDEIIVASKSTAPTKEEMKRDIRSSIQKLGLKKIPLYQLHGVDDEQGLYFKMKNALEALKKAKRNELIDWIGIHGQHIPTLVKAVKTEEFDTVMLPYNYAYDEAEELIDLAHSLDIGVIVMEPFGRGLLVNPNRLKKELCKEDKIILNHETALKWIMSNKKISTVIPGGNKEEYVQKNAKVANSHYFLTPEKREDIHETVKRLVKDEYFRLCDNPWRQK